jgi:putative sporulation protein YtaF
MLSALLIAVAANLDNLGVGIAYGARRVAVAPLPNLFIAVLAAVGTAVFGLVGHGVRHLIPPGWADAIGATILVAVGIWVMVEAGVSGERQASRAPGVSDVLRDPTLADRDRSGDLSWPEAAVLAVALSINAWAGGIGAGLVGVDIPLVAGLTGVMSYLMLWGGAVVGRRALAGTLGEKASVAAGILLILVGLHQLL